MVSNLCWLPWACNLILCFQTWQHCFSRHALGTQQNDPDGTCLQELRNQGRRLAKDRQSTQRYGIYAHAHTSVDFAVCFSPSPSVPVMTVRTVSSNRTDLRRLEWVVPSGRITMTASWLDVSPVPSLATKKDTETKRMIRGRMSWNCSRC